MASESAALAPSRQPQAVAAPQSGMLGLTLFSIGHFFIDLYSSALGVFQPLLIDKLHFSLSQAGLLGGLLSFSSSVTQPAYGYLSDRFHSRLFSALAPAVAGIFIATLGLAPSYGYLVAMVLLGGCGIASFHPQASSRATEGLRNRGRWMAVFISAGTLGLAVGPAYFSGLFHFTGLRGAAWGAIPGIVVTLLLLAVLPERERPATAVRHRFDLRPLHAVWKPLTVLYCLVFLRSVVQVGFSQFLPLYLSRERGFSTPDAGWALTLYLGCGAAGGFMGGHLADRFGGRRVILTSMAGCVPFLALFFFTHGVWSILGLALGGLMLLFTMPVNVVMAQELVPSQAGTVSALMMGFAWGMAGLIFIPLTGWAADHYTLHIALSVQMILPVIGFFLAMKLPK